MNARPARAQPMAPTDRRQAILDVVIPLLIEKGPTLTTAEMAEAAGIAEGTIFRVFPDKRALIYEAAKATMDAKPVADAIRAIPESVPFRAQLDQAARELLDYFNRTIALGELLRSLHSGQSGHGARQCDVRSLVAESSATLTKALSALFERHADVLRVSPVAAIAAFRGLVLASGHPLLPPSERLGVDDVVNILISGITKPAGA